MAGLAASFGSGAMTNSISELEDADAILVTGSNPTEMHPVIGSYIKRAVRKNGTKLIVVDPRKIDLVFFAEKWLRPLPGTDIAWINGMINVIIRENLHDETFIEERTEGFEGLAEVVERYSPSEVERITGIPKEDLIEAARIYAQAPAASIVYAMGITQHTTGTDNVKALANLAMVCGNVGRPSVGVNPLRGQNNVQGACDMGCLPNVYPGYQPVSDASAREKMAKAWGLSSLPADAGLTVQEIINAAEVIVESRRGSIKARASVTERAVEGTVFIPFHFWESPVNRLTIAALDPVVKIPEYKVCAVRIKQV